MPGIGDIMRIALGLVGAGADAQGRDQANAANERRYHELLGGEYGGKDYGQGEIADALAEYNKQSEGISGGDIAQQDQMGALLRSILSGGQDQLNQGYTNLRSRVMGNLEGQGKQERKDITRQFGEANAMDQARLRGLGMGNSTVGASLGMGNQRAMADALGASNERTNRQFADADMVTTGNILNNQANAMNQKMGLLGQYGDGTTRGNRQQATQSGAAYDRLGKMEDLARLGWNIKTNRNDVYQPSIPADLYRQLTMAPYDPPNLFTQALAGGLGTGLGAAGGQLLGAGVGGLFGAGAAGLGNLFGGGGFGTGRWF